jgi:hypothetical protein
MRKLTLITLLCAFFAVQLVANNTSEKDTVTIKIGNSKIIIQAANKEELKALSEYDINQMLADLNQSIDSLGSEKTITIKNEGEGFEVVSTEDDQQKPREVETVMVNDKNKSNVTIRINSKSDGEKSGRGSNYNKWGFGSQTNFEIGTNNWLSNGSFPSESNELYTVRPWGSWYVAISQKHSSSLGGPLFLVWGADVSCYNWKFQDESVRVTKEANEVNFYQETTFDNLVKSKLSASYINVSMVPMLDFGYKRTKVEGDDGSVTKKTTSQGDNFRIGVGMYAGYRMGSRSKFVYKDDGRSKDEKDKSDFYLTNFRYGIRGQIGYRGTDIFVNYDLNEVFAAGRGPKLNAISFGVIL